MSDWDSHKAKDLREWDRVRRDVLEALAKVGHDIVIVPDENGNEADIYKGEE